MASRTTVSERKYSSDTQEGLLSDLNASEHNFLLTNKKLVIRVNANGLNHSDTKMHQTLPVAN